jgi:hypothetical protein
LPGGRPQPNRLGVVCKHGVTRQADGRATAAPLPVLGPCGPAVRVACHRETAARAAGQRPWAYSREVQQRGRATAAAYYCQQSPELEASDERPALPLVRDEEAERVEPDSRIGLYLDQGGVPRPALPLRDPPGGARPSTRNPAPSTVNSLCV